MGKISQRTKNILSQYINLLEPLNDLYENQPAQYYFTAQPFIKKLFFGEIVHVRLATSATSPTSFPILFCTVMKCAVATTHCGAKKSPLNQCRFYKYGKYPNLPKPNIEVGSEFNQTCPRMHPLSSPGFNEKICKDGKPGIPFK